MKKFLSAIVCAAIMLTSTAMPSAAWWPWDDTDTKEYTTNTYVEFYVQRFGIQMDTDGNISAQDTVYFTPKLYESALENGKRPVDYSIVYEEGKVSSKDVIAEVRKPPTDELVFEEIKNEYENKGYILTSSGNVVDWDEFDTDSYEVRWYVLKLEDDWMGGTWHVDGVIIEKETNEPIEIPSEDDPEYVPPEEVTPKPTDEPETTEAPTEPPVPTEEPVPTAEPVPTDAPIDVEGYHSNYAYIFGYDDTTMGAEGHLLRSEISAMIHRLVKQNDKLGGFVYDASAEPVFADIAGEWFRSGVEFMTYRGAFDAGENDYVYPYAEVTRGEAFKLICVGLGFTDNSDLSYEEYALALKEAGYVEGDENGDLNIEDLITRAEFCAIYNRIIGRDGALLETADGTAVTAATYNFTDLNDGQWYYETMLRATSAYDDDGYVDIALRAVRNNLDDYE